MVYQGTEIAAVFRKQGQVRHASWENIHALSLIAFL